MRTWPNQNAMTPAVMAADYGLPIEAVEEFIAYCQTPPPEIHACDRRDLLSPCRDRLLRFHFFPRGRASSPWTAGGPGAGRLATSPGLWASASILFGAAKRNSTRPCVPTAGSPSLNRPKNGERSTQHLTAIAFASIKGSAPRLAIRRSATPRRVS